MSKRHAPPLPILAEILILSDRSTIRVNYSFADTWQCRHVGSQNNASFSPPIFIEKSLVHSGGKSFCSCEPTWLSRRQMQTSNTNSTRDCSWQIKPAENWCESKRAGFFYSRRAIFFNVYCAWKCIRKKKFHYHLKNVFIVSLSPSTFDWFTGYFLPVSDWSQTRKQTQNRYRFIIYRCFILFGFGETIHYTLFSHQNFCIICHENRCHCRMSNYILMIRDIIITGLFLITATN